MDVQKRKIVYICSAYSGNIEKNTRLARWYCRLAIERGCIPLAPHLLLPQFLSEETERELAIAIDLRLLDLCQEIWICGDVITKGMKHELPYALATGMPVSFIEEASDEHFNSI